MRTVLHSMFHVPCSIQAFSLTTGWLKKLFTGPNTKKSVEKLFKKRVWGAPLTVYMARKTHMFAWKRDITSWRRGGGWKLEIPTKFRESFHKIGWKGQLVLLAFNHGELTWIQSLSMPIKYHERVIGWLYRQSFRFCIYFAKLWWEV